MIPRPSQDFSNDAPESGSDRDAAHLQTLLFDSLPQAIVAGDREGKVVAINRAAAQLFGWSSAEGVGRDVWEVAGAPELNALFLQVAANGGSNTPIEPASLSHRNGEQFRAAIRIRPTIQADGAIIGAIVVVDPITDALKQDIDPPRLSDGRQFAHAQKLAGIATWTVDLLTGEHEWSDGLRRLLGFDRDTEASLEEALARFEPGEAARLGQLAANAYATREPFETDLRHNVGGEKIFSVSVTFPSDDQQPPRYAIGLVRDVTEARRTRDALRRRIDQQSALSELGQFALSGASLAQLLDRTAAAICQMMGVSAVEVLHHDGGEFKLASQSTCGVASPERAAMFTTGSQARFTLESKEPVISCDLCSETRFESSAVALERGLIRSVFVPIILSNGKGWGVLAAHGRNGCGPSEHDIDSLRTAASILGQAIGRLESDSDNIQRVRRQSALAAVARLTLTSFGPDVYERSCEIARDGVEADLAVYGELRDTTFAIIAGSPRDDTFRFSEAGGAENPFWLAFVNAQPLVVDDYRNEPRFESHFLTLAPGILSEAIVPVASHGVTFGVLSVQAQRVAAFGESEIEFLEGIARMLADAFDRERWFRAIEESEQRQRQILDGASEIIYTVSADARLIDLNPAFEKVTGWKRSEWLGRSFIDLIVESDRSAARSRFGEILELVTPRGMELSIQGKHGIVELELKSFPRVENGVVSEVYGFGRDITEERRARRGREELTRSLQLLLESTVEGIFTLDLEGRCTMINQSACLLLGRSRDELLGQKIHRFVHPQSIEASGLDADCPLQMKADRWYAGNVTNQLVWRKDGSSFPVDYSVAPIVDGGAPVGAVVTFTDITQRLALESKLAQANRLSDLGKLSAVVAHEFNNVLMGISPFVEILRRHPSPEKIELAHNQIMASIKRGRRITTDILRFTQPSEPLVTTFDLAPWMAGVVREASSILGDSCTLVVSGDENDVRLVGDASQLQQVLMNLVLNARDAMTQGGRLTIAASREEAGARFPFGSVRDPDKNLHVALTDNGCGMTRDVLVRVFEPLFTSKRNGTGLGLPITQSIVERHGGQIFVESEPGVGTTFHLFLPLAVEETAAAPEAGAPAPPVGDVEQILLVEDDTGVAAGLMSLLEADGFSVTLAPTGAEAIRLARAKRPDAVILDIGLPDMDGRDVFLELMEIDRTLPVVFSTGHGEREQVEDLIASSAVDFLLKPYDGTALLGALSRAVARRTALISG